MVMQAGGAEKENPFMPKEYGCLSPDLEVWQDIRRAYAKFPTQESLRRVAALRIVAHGLEDEGFIADLLIGGSLAVGQSIRESDIDIFGIVTSEKGLDARAVTREYEARLYPELGYKTIISDDHEGHLIVFGRQDLMTYLNNDYFISLTHRAWIRDMRKKVIRLHAQHYTSLGIGSCRSDLMERIEDLKDVNPQFNKDLNPADSFSYFSKFYNISFARYLERLVKHTDFSSLPEIEKVQFIEHLEECQQQFLFYIQNP